MPPQSLCLKTPQSAPPRTLQNGGYIARLGDYKNVPQIALENVAKCSVEDATKWRLHRALGGLQERATSCTRKGYKTFH